MKDNVVTFPKVTVILRGYSYEECRCVVGCLVGSRIGSVEIAMNTPGAGRIIEGLTSEFGEEIMIGAGTVVTPERAKTAINAGSKFLLSPVCFTDEIFDIARDAGVVTVPAGFSPTEIYTMLEKGADIVKVFPAARVGPKYFSDIQGPLDALPLMAVGGVNAENAQGYFDGGATYVGIGSGIFNPADIRAMNIDEIGRQIRIFEEKIRW